MRTNEYNICRMLVSAKFTAINVADWMYGCPGFFYKSPEEHVNYKSTIKHTLKFNLPSYKLFEIKEWG